MSTLSDFGNFDLPSFRKGAIYCEPYRHGGEHLLLGDRGSASPQDRIDEARYQVSLGGARVGVDEPFRGSAGSRLRHKRPASVPFSNVALVP